jgi:mono/diheme cytochrome c family protein
MSMPKLIHSLVAIVGLSLLAGCHKPTANTLFVDSEQVQKLPMEVQDGVRKFLLEQCGTPSHPKTFVETKVDPRRLELGRTLYVKRCTQCHGASGDGAGPQAAFMYPRPRDYRKGIFKFITTGYGNKPVREDLIRTIRQGVMGTSMPSFHLLKEAEIQAIVDYVLALAHRGELEFQLASEHEAEDKFDPDLAADSVKLIQARWAEAPGLVFLPLSPQPIFTAEHVAAGKAAFLTKGCAKCHGDDGRGQTPENLGGKLVDKAWNTPTRAADLTSGMLRGGQTPLAVYRRIFGGINGTPMPEFRRELADQPEMAWNLVAYVMHVSGRRREHEVPSSGSIAPYVTTLSSTPAATADQQE